MRFTLRDKIARYGSDKEPKTVEMRYQINTLKCAVSGKTVGCSSA